MTVSQQISPSVLRSLRVSKYAFTQKTPMMLEAKRAKRVTSQFMSKSGVKEAAKRMKQLKKAAEITDKLIENAKGSDKISKATNVGKTIAGAGNFLTKFAPLIALIATIGLTTLTNELQGWRADINEKGQESLSASISKIYGTLQTYKDRIENNKKAIEKSNLENQRIRDRIYAVEKEQPKISKKANDALYEAREGKKTVTGLATAARQLANDALFETRQGKIKMEATIRTLEARIKALAMSTGAQWDAQLEAIRKSFNDQKNSFLNSFTQQANAIRSKEQLDAIRSKQQLDAIRNSDQLNSVRSKEQLDAVRSQEQLNAVRSKEQLDAVRSQEQLNAARSKEQLDAARSQEQLNAVRSQEQLDAIRNSDQLNNVRSKEQLDAIRNSFNFTNANVSALQTQMKVVQAGSIAAVESKLAGFQKRIESEGTFNRETRDSLFIEIDKLKKTSSEADQKALAYFQEKLNSKLQELYLKQDTLQGQVSNLITSPNTTLLDSKIAELSKSWFDSKSALQTTFNEVTSELNQQATNTQTQIKRIETEQKEQKKVNNEALPKLDQILGALPLIPGRAAAAIRPSIPTISQIETAAATGTCRTTQPGGCMTRALNDNAANINNNTNSNAGNILDAVNTGANAALLAGQQTIITRLGAQLPGGIGGKLSRFADWMHLDRALNIMIFAATVHNALMLSNDIGQTLLGAINNVLQLIGLKKEDGSAFDLGSVISGSIESLIKGAIGADNYTNLKEAWAKANRIYQASVNILNSFQGLASSILTGLEMTAGKVAKIGNALRNAGEVLENAYGWMNPQPKFNRVTQTLESLQQGASTIQMVTQAPLDVINATTELTTATTELTKAIKEDDKPENKGKEAPEPDKLKADLATAKVASAGLEIEDTDLEADD